MVSPSRLRSLALPIARLVWGLVTVAALAATYAETASRGAVNPFNFFGYFTIQSNVLLAVTAIASGTYGMLRPGVQPRWLVALRGLTTVCMVIVGLVYVTMLAPLGVEGGVPLPWANVVMHVAGPLLVALDWALARDRSALPWRVAGWQLCYPLGWIAVVLARGATDGWVPYPFLDPAQGYPAVAGYVLVIALVFFAVSLLVVWWSRRRRSASATTRTRRGRD